MQEDIIFASLPCGVMRDLLKLDFAGVENFRLAGIYIDSESLELAKKLAQEYRLSETVEFYRKDAFKLPFEDEFTLLSQIPHFKYTTRVFLTKKVDYSLYYC